MRKKIGLLFLVVAFLASIGNEVNAATDDVTVNLGVTGTISIDCTEPVTMGAIPGTGQSALATNETTCNIKTNNVTGYKLEWQASSATMSNGSQTIAAYTSTVPEEWTVASSASEWGARLKSTSDEYNTTTWGTTTTDDYGALSKWFKVSNTAPYQIASRGTETVTAGSNEIIQFGAEVGSTKIQQTGTYTVDVTFTATTNI